MKDYNVTTCLEIITSLGLVLVVRTLADGWALFTIWNWFIPPIFGLTSLTLWKAIGVSMVFEIFTRNNKKAKAESKSDIKTIGEAIIANLIEILFVPTLSVLIAWIVFQFAF